MREFCTHLHKQSKSRLLFNCCSPHCFSSRHHCFANCFFVVVKMKSLKQHDDVLKRTFLVLWRPSKKTDWFGSNSSSISHRDIVHVHGCLVAEENMTRHGSPPPRSTCWFHGWSVSEPAPPPAGRLANWRAPNLIRNILAFVRGVCATAEGYRTNTHTHTHAHTHTHTHTHVWVAFWGVQPTPAVLIKWAIPPPPHTRSSPVADVPNRHRGNTQKI